MKSYHGIIVTCFSYFWRWWILGDRFWSTSLAYVDFFTNKAWYAVYKLGSLKKSSGIQGFGIKEPRKAILRLRKVILSTFSFFRYRLRHCVSSCKLIRRIFNFYGKIRFIPILIIDCNFFLTFFFFLNLLQDRSNEMFRITIPEE